MIIAGYLGCWIAHLLNIASVLLPLAFLFSSTNFLILNNS